MKQNYEITGVEITKRQRQTNIPDKVVDQYIKGVRECLFTVTDELGLSQGDLAFCLEVSDRQMYRYYSNQTEVIKLRCFCNLIYNIAVIYNKNYVFTIRCEGATIIIKMEEDKDSQKQIG